jgi:NAD(P)-dependent dehydrogenase (short-subunit alcohol dehydrogenase family)
MIRFFRATIFCATGWTATVLLATMLSRALWVAALLACILAAAWTPLDLGGLINQLQNMVSDEPCRPPEGTAVRHHGNPPHTDQRHNPASYPAPPNDVNHDRLAVGGSHDPRVIFTSGRPEGGPDDASVVSSRAASSRRTVLITGGCGGIGYASAELFLLDPIVDVWLLCRPGSASTSAARRTFKQHMSSGRVRMVDVDLGSLASVREAAATIHADLSASNRSIALLFLNAYQLGAPRTTQRTAEGFELGIGVGHVGHFDLARLLVPRMSASSETRAQVVTFGSGMHHMATSRPMKGSRAWREEPPMAPDASFADVMARTYAGKSGVNAPRAKRHAPQVCNSRPLHLTTRADRPGRTYLTLSRCQAAPAHVCDRTGRKGRWEGVVEHGQCGADRLRAQSADAVVGQVGLQSRCPPLFPDPHRGGAGGSQPRSPGRRFRWPSQWKVLYVF